MTILVTGAAGQLGGELCRQLGGAAAPLDRRACDLADAAAVRRVFERFAPTAVINAAAYTQVDRAEQERDACWAVNVTVVEQLAELCRAQDIPLLQVSTDYVFGKDVERRRPYVETDPTGPLGTYAASKLEGEWRAAVWAKHFIVRTCGLYIGNPASPIRGRNFVDTMLALGRARPSLRVVNDQWCTPSYVPHVARAILFLLGAEHYGTYHVVNGGHATWFEFATEIFRLANLPVTLEPITAAEYGAPAPRPGYSVLNTDKYHALGGPKMPAWQDGLADYFGSR